MIDTHCHLAYPGLKEINEKVIEEARRTMDAIVTCGYPKDWKESLELKKKHEGFIFLTMGLHPIDIEKMTDKEVEEYLDIIRSHAGDIVAIGEIGLDKHWYPAEKFKELNERFERIFVDCLQLAKELRLPTVLHLRKAEEDGYKIITETGMKEGKVDFHCYAGNLTLARKIIDTGYYISLATNIDRSNTSKDIAKKLPLDRLLTETDSPFLPPERKWPNKPQNVKFVIETIARERKIAIEEVDRQTTENARRFFSLPVSALGSPVLGH